MRMLYTCLITYGIMTISGVHFSDGFCLGCLERFISCISLKVTIDSYWVKHSEDIINLLSESTDKHSVNKAMNFSVQAKISAILYGCFLLKYE